MKNQYIQEICCLERVLDLIKTIKNLWYEPYEDIENQECGISFGSENGYVIYNYTTSIKKEIERILNEMDVF